MSSSLPGQFYAAVFQQTEEGPNREDIVEPQETPAAGKVILKRRHKSADESQPELKPQRVRPSRSGTAVRARCVWRRGPKAN